MGSCVGLPYVCWNCPVENIINSTRLLNCSWNKSECTLIIQGEGATGQSIQNFTRSTKEHHGSPWDGFVKSTGPLCCHT